MSNRYVVEGVRSPVDQVDTAFLLERVSTLLKLEKIKIKECKVVRKSLDARKKPPVYVFNLEILVEEGIEEGVFKGLRVHRSPGFFERVPIFAHAKRKRRPVVVGSGPAGLFAALTLAINGFPPLIVERGKPVEERVKDVESFWNGEGLNEESNVYFGEGGAGTFSDGKLTTRVRNPYDIWVKKVLVKLGASPEILIDAKPHIGTDKLRTILFNFRLLLKNKGCEFLYESRVTDIQVHRGGINGLVINEREVVKTDGVILAIGQSADDTYEMLHRRGVHLEKKPFAMGLRVEHPQDVINAIQYGRWVKEMELPPADYNLKTTLRVLGRSVYTFCMCPGGRVIACSPVRGVVVTNGMSESGRNEPFANSAVVVNVTKEDIDGSDPLAGLRFRRFWEERAFHAGGGNYFAPAQRLMDFLEGKDSPEISNVSYRPGVTPAVLDELLPNFVVVSIREGLKIFNCKMPGFLCHEANLIGVETRTSSPIRIVRGDNGQSITLRGLFPCGEGAGYAGGIMSSALDGIRIAEKVLCQ
ncbi:MAG: hypothetical protein N2317_05745 [Syntrophales bacterium]|nr:hypothetical protein [Syntrophales bacterium]